MQMKQLLFIASVWCIIPTCWRTCIFHILWQSLFRTRFRL